MKIEKLFEVKANKLFKIADGSEIENPQKLAFCVKWSDVEFAESEYNEGFLADLRNKLKSLEQENRFIFIEPIFDKDAPVSRFISAMKHVSRRIKDCACVIGFAIPEKIACDSATMKEYTANLSDKHEYYVYFCKKNQNDNIVLY